jgi:hypothetical protein
MCLCRQYPCAALRCLRCAAVHAQAVQAAQLTFEDFFMADMDIPGVRIVGFEGVFGMIGTLLVMAPIAYYLPGGIAGGTARPRPLYCNGAA